MSIDDESPAETKTADALRAYLDDSETRQPQPPEAETVRRLRDIADAADDAVIARAWSRIAARPRPMQAAASRRWMPLVAMAAAVLLAVGSVVVLSPAPEVDAIPVATSAELKAATSALADTEASPGRRLARLQAAAEPARRRIVRRLTDG